MCLARVGRFAEASRLWMLRDILTFNTQSTEDYKSGKLAGLTRLTLANIFARTTSRRSC